LIELVGGRDGRWRKKGKEATSRGEKIGTREGSRVEQKVPLPQVNHTKGKCPNGRGGLWRDLVIIKMGVGYQTPC